MTVAIQDDVAERAAHHYLNVVAENNQTHNHENLDVQQDPLWKTLCPCIGFTLLMGVIGVVFKCWIGNHC